MIYWGCVPKMDVRAYYSPQLWFWINFSIMKLFVEHDTSPKNQRYKYWCGSEYELVLILAVKTTPYNEHNLWFCDRTFQFGFEKKEKDKKKLNVLKTKRIPYMFWPKVKKTLKPEINSNSFNENGKGIPYVFTRWLI